MKKITISLLALLTLSTTILPSCNKREDVNLTQNEGATVPKSETENGITGVFLIKTLIDAVVEMS